MRGVIRLQPSVLWHVLCSENFDTLKVELPCPSAMPVSTRFVHPVEKPADQASGNLSDNMLPYVWADFLTEGILVDEFTNDAFESVFVPAMHL
jgi:hypothetical protein